MATQLTRKQVGGPTNGRGETCRQLRQDRGPTCRQLGHRRQVGTEPIGRRAIGILSILQALTIGDFLIICSGLVSVAWRKTSRQLTGCVKQHTHRVAHARSHFITRTHVAQELQSSGLHIFVVPKMVVLHVSCLIPCRTWH